MDAKELARQALAVLNLQQVYFKTRTATALNESKDAERRLRATCIAVLAGKKQGNLLDGQR